MKLRNKKTGKIQEIVVMPVIGGYPDETVLVDGEISLKEFNKVWEDYELRDPLIKDDKIRKTVRAWADINGYKKCLVRVYDYDRMGVCIEEGVTSFVSCDTKLGITFFNIDLDIKTETVYTITELCGEEE